MSFGKGLNSLISPSGSSASGGKAQSNQRHSHSTPPPHILHEEIYLAPLHRKEKNDQSPLRLNENDSRRESVFQIETEKIQPNPYQPRTSFAEKELEELASSVREFGVLQPVVVSKIVRETDTGTRVEYQLIAGERRLMAAKRAGLERIPAIVRKGDTSKVKFELALIENLQRSNLSPLESARAYQRLQEEFGLTQKAIATRVGKSREVVANTMRLLSLPPYLMEALREGKISESHARHLLSIPRESQKELYLRLINEGMSTRRMKEKINEEKTPDPERRYLERKFEEKFGVPVSIAKNGARGKITIQFYSEEEYRSLLKELLGESLE